MSIIKQIRDTIQTLASQSDPSKAKRFFKTTPGTYSEHDIFLGIPVPELRKLAKVFKEVELDLLQALLESQINEERALSLLILVSQYQSSNSSQQKIIYDFYTKNIKYINNWNLVDMSAHFIVGAFLYQYKKSDAISTLESLATSNHLWSRRISIVATWYFIKQSALDTTFYISIILLDDKEDLINKAVGWMLREAGKKDINSLKAFLLEYNTVINRTSLRYAIEKLSSIEKLKFLSVKKQQ